MSTAAAPPAPSQIPLFTSSYVELVACYPHLGSVDSAEYCRGRDGQDYKIKDGTTRGAVPEVPHSEWFCTNLGELVEIAGPPGKVCRKASGEFVFGSRWEGGVIDPNGPSGAWHTWVK